MVTTARRLYQCWVKHLHRSFYHACSQGFDVAVNGWVSGALSRLGVFRDTASTSFVVEFWPGSSYGFNQTINRINGETSWSVSENFALSQTLVAPGEMLLNEQTFVIPVRIALGAPASPQASTLDNVAPGSAFADSAFFDSARISSIVMPDGVTWSSESGAFLSAVPVPAAVWLFVSSLLGIVLTASRTAGA